MLNYRNIEPDRTVLAKIQSDLGASGIDVVLNPLIPGNFWSAYRGGLAEAVYSLWGPDYVSPDNWAQVFASGEGTAAQRLNYNPLFSDLPNAAIATTDVDSRTEVYRDIQLQLLDDAVFIGIMQEETVDAFGPDHQGLQGDRALAGQSFRPLQGGVAGTILVLASSSRGGQDGNTTVMHAWQNGESGLLISGHFPDDSRGSVRN